MKWLNQLTGRAKSHTLTPKIKATDIVDHTGLPIVILGNGEHIYREPTLLKKLKWVTWKSRVGIVSDLSSAGTAVVDMVDAQGLTIEVVRCPVGEISLAKCAEIPQVRRHPDPDYMAMLGYI